MQAFSILFNDSFSVCRGDHRSPAFVIACNAAPAFLILSIILSGAFFYDTPCHSE